MKLPRKRRPGRSARQDAWAKSAQCAATLASARGAAAKAVALAPKCGARTKGSGRPCQLPVVEGRARCRRHGGATPRGADWHRVQWGRPGMSTAQLEAKLRSLERRRKKRAAKVAAMTPDERQRFEARSKAMRPRTAAQRTAAVHDRATRAVFLEAQKRPPRPSPHEAELRALQERRAALEARLAALLAPENEREGSVG